VASFAEMMYGTAQKTSEGMGQGLPEAVATGAGLALKAEQVQIERDKITEEKKQIATAKLNKLYDYLKESRNFKEPGARNNYLKGAIGYRNSLGIDPSAITDEQLMSLGFNENQGRMAALDLEIRAGRLSTPEALKIATNKEAFAKVIPLPADSAHEANFSAAQKEFLDRQEKANEAKLRATAGNARGDQINERFDQSQMTKLADKVTNLGLPGLRTAVASMDKNIPGGLDGYKPGTPIPGISGADAALPTNRLSGKGNKLRGDALSIGNQIIKMRTGAAMSDGEAGRILSEIGFTPVVGEGGKWTGLVWNGKTSEESFINGMRRARENLNAQESVYRNAYGPDVFEKVMKPPTPAGGGGKTFTIGGKSFTEDALRLFLKEHPDDPAAPEVKRQLGVK
jgi:hypothetical protein